MAKNIRRIFAMALVMCMLVSALPMQALAAESVTETEPTPDGGTVTTVTTTETTTDTATGDVVVTIEIQQDTANAGGEIISSSHSDITETTTADSTVLEDGTTVVSGTVTEKGTETTVAPVAPNVTVDIPLTAGGSDSATTPEKAPVVTDNKQEGDENTILDQTTTTTVSQGSVEITTESVTVTEKIDSDRTNLEYVDSKVVVNGENDLVLPGGGDVANEQYQNGYNGVPQVPTGTDGYEYTYVGSSNSGKFFPAVVFTEPMTVEQKLAEYGNNAYIGSSYTDYYIGCLPQEVKDTIQKDENGNYVKDENGFILDVNGERIMKEEITTKGPEGETYYLHRFDSVSHNSFNVEGWYQNGEWEKELNGTDKYHTPWCHATQYILVDRDGKIATAYSADYFTNSRGGYGYNAENLEDSEKFSDEEAKMLRTIALNGYWGTTGTETDDEGNTVPALGSLEALKAKLLESGFSAEDLASLNDGVAQTATQMAIWACSNNNGIEFVNAFYSNWGTGNVPKDKEDEVKLMFRVYEYLMDLTPAETTGTTADTIINSENFVKDMSVTVIEKAEHANNNDADTGNDAYVTRLTFSLVVAPSEDDEGNLTAYVLAEDGVTVLASGRIGGNYDDSLPVDEFGNYYFDGLTMIEGKQNFKLNLKGIQHLEEGVYVYTSEVRNGYSSKGMIGLVKEGERSVDVTMDINFSLNVEDEIVATERIWETETDYSYEIPAPMAVNAEDSAEPVAAAAVFRLNNQDGLTEIAEEEVPLAAPVITGDNSFLWIAVVMAAMFGMVAINLSDKKQKTF